MDRDDDQDQSLGLVGQVVERQQNRRKRHHDDVPHRGQQQG